VKKYIKLTESDLTRIIKRVISEQENDDACVQEELDTLNDFLCGIVTLEPQDIGGELSHEDLLSSVIQRIP
jgi:hypothetical protein